MQQKAGDDSISRTFDMVGDITKNIGDTVGKIPVVGTVVKPIFDIFGDVGNGISKAFSWMGLGAHINQIEDHLRLDPITEAEIDFYDQVHNGETPYLEYIEHTGSSHHGGKISDVLEFIENGFKKYNNTNFSKIPLVGNTINNKKDLTNDIQQSAKVIKNVARFFGLGQNIQTIKAGLALDDKQDILDNYYGKEYDTPDVQEIVKGPWFDNYHGKVYPSQKGEDIVIEGKDGGQYIIENSAGQYIIENKEGGKYIIKHAGQYEIEGGKNGNDPSKWIIGGSKGTTKNKENKENKYVHKLMMRAKRINHHINKK